MAAACRDARDNMLSSSISKTKTKNESVKTVGESTKTVKITISNECRDRVASSLMDSSDAPATPSRPFPKMKATPKSEVE